MRIANKITEKAIQDAIKAGRFLISSGIEEGLYLQLKSVKQPIWRYKYKVPGGGKKKNIISLGPLSRVSIKNASELARDARNKVERGIDPALEKKRGHGPEIATQFQAAAEKWFAAQVPAWSENHIKDTNQKLQKYILPEIGYYPLSEVSRESVKQILDRLQAEGKHATLKKVKLIISQVLKYGGVEFGLNIVDHTKQFDRHYVAPKVKHQAALTRPDDIARLMKDIEAYKSTNFITGLALKFSALTFCRPVEVRYAEWSEIDALQNLWIILASKMKARERHMVPLARQTLELLAELKPVTGHSRFLFPNTRSATRPMSEVTVLAAIRRLGYSKDEMCAHGFRGMASTILNLKGFNKDFIELQLAHKLQNEIRDAYMHTKFLGARREMAQWWADYLDALATDGPEPPFPDFFQISLDGSITH